MTTTELYAGELLLADAATRSLTYRLLAYGETGRTNMGALTVPAGVLELPAAADQLVGNLEHDYTRPVARCVELHDDTRELVARFEVADTGAGRDLMAEAAAGLRTGASVEVRDPVVRDGRLESGALSGVGFVTRPAFPSSQLLSSEPHPDTPEDPVPETPPDPTPETPAPEPATAPAPAMTGVPAAAPAGLQGARPPQLPNAADLIAAAARGELTDRQLEAALSDWPVGAPASNPSFERGWLGSVWQAVIERRPFCDAFGITPATTFQYVGFALTDGLHVADYAGDKAAIASNVPTLAAVSVTLARMAGGVDIDRAYIDLGSPSIVTSIVEWAMRDYRVKVEAKVQAAALAAATVAAGGPFADGLTAIGAVVGAHLGNGANVDALFVAPDVFSALLKVNPTFAFLGGNLSFDGTGSVGGVSPRPVAALPAKTVVAVDSRAGTVWEKVLEVNALDIAKAGVDEAVYGYWGFLVNDARGITKGTTA